MGNTATRIFHCSSESAHAIVKTTSLNEFQQFVDYILTTYNINKTYPEVATAITYFFIVKNGYWVPFTHVIAYYDADCTKSLLMYRRLLFLYSTTFFTHEFATEALVIDEIDTCLDIVAQHPHKRFKPSRYFRNKCIRFYLAVKEIYNCSPIVCACHTVYMTGKKCGNYICEQFFLSTFKIDKTINQLP